MEVMPRCFSDQGRNAICAIDGRCHLSEQIRRGDMAAVNGNSVIVFEVGVECSTEYTCDFWCRHVIDVLIHNRLCGAVIGDHNEVFGVNFSLYCADRCGASVVVECADGVGVFAALPAMPVVSVSDFSLSTDFTIS